MVFRTKQDPKAAPTNTTHPTVTHPVHPVRAPVTGIHPFALTRLLRSGECGESQQRLGGAVDTTHGTQKRLPGWLI